MLVHEYEDQLVRQLPPNAQRVAELLLSRLSLSELLAMRDNGDVDVFLLNEHKVNQELWVDIMRAIILARITYFDPSPLLNQEKILLLVKLAVETAGFSLSTPLPQIVAEVKEDYPRLTTWLVQMAQLLSKLKSAP
ncbi:MAG: hypothetical protein K0U21_06890 [Proteobacteria bacterium]|nr:hypothetical protein [Pseudomonadota bacterium]